MDKRESFWTTIPGIVTAIAGLITALAGLITALALAGVFSNHPSDKQVSSPPPQAKATPYPSPTPAPIVTAAASSGLIRVWVNLDSRKYHCPATQWYGATRHGTYMSQKDAQGQGYVPAYGRACQ